MHFYGHQSTHNSAERKKVFRISWKCCKSFIYIFRHALHALVWAFYPIFPSRSSQAVKFGEQLSNWHWTGVLSSVGSGLLLRFVGPLSENCPCCHSSIALPLRIMGVFPKSMVANVINNFNSWNHAVVMKFSQNHSLNYQSNYVGN